MNLLLLLSALFGALTGVTGGTRTATPAEQVAVVRSVVAAATAPRPTAVLAFQANDAFAARYAVTVLVRFAFAETPRFASRRRE